MKVRIMLVLLALVMPTVTSALGLGKLELQSALNQPFKARVKLISATADEIDSLKVSLADQEAFDRAGIQRTFLLTRLRFTVQETDKGPDYIQIRSNESIREPFLNFLLEVNWSKGRLYREYTVLLDPPTYVAPGSKKQAVVHPKTPVVEVESGDHQVVYDLEYKPETRPLTKPRASESTRSTPSYESPTAISYSGSGDYGPAVTGDTLWSIAKATRPDSSVSIQQMMLAILRTNPEAFIENNINGLKRGAILQMPDSSEINSLNQAEAFEQAKNQNGLWDEYKGYVATSVSTRPKGADVSRPEIEPVDTEREVSVTEIDETDEAELRLISESDQDYGSDQSTAESAGVNVDALKNELVLVNESIEALTMENAELKDKLTETEGIIDDLKRLIVLKEDELAAMQEQIMIAAAEQEDVGEVATEAVVEEVVVEDAEIEIVEETEEEFIEEAEEVIKEETEVSESEEVVVEEADVAPADGDGALFGLMGLVEKAKDNLMMIATVIGGLLVLVFLMLFASKRRSAKAAVAEVPADDFPDFGDDTSEKTVAATDELAEEDSEAITVIPGSDDDDVTDLPEEVSDDADLFEIPEIPEDSSTAAVEEEEVDPMEEVNTFLAYEHFDEAESFVREGLKREPDNLNFHDKLLEVFYAAGNKKSYEEAARVVHEKTGGQGDHWNMATAMWQEMSPNRALFETPIEGEDEEASSDTSGVGVLNIAADDETDKGEMDLNIGEEASEESVLDVTAATDIDSIPAAEEADAEEVSNDLDFSLDLEPGEGEIEQVQQAEESGLEEEASAEDILDVTAATDIDSIPAAEEADAEEVSNDLDFSLDLEPDEGEVEQVQQAEESGLEEEVLDVTMATNVEDEIGESVNEEPLEFPSAEESTDSEGLDFSLDEDSLASEGEEELDISIAQESDDANVLDISLDEPSSEDEFLDISIAEDSDDTALLDEPLDTKATEGAGEEDDLLDVTTAYDFQAEGGEDLLDVTAAASAEDIDSGELLEPDTEQDKSDEIDLDLSLGEESLDIDLEDDLSSSTENKTDDELMDIDETTDDDSEDLDFDLGIDDDSNEITDLELDNSEDSNDIDLDITDIGMESDSGSDTDSGSVDMESTIQMPQAKIESLSMEEEDDDDKTFMVPKSSDVDEQSVDEEMASQLDLAKAYIELGDNENAKTILDEIIAQGSEDYRKQAEELIGQIN